MALRFEREESPPQKISKLEGALGEKDTQLTQLIDSSSVLK